MLPERLSLPKYEAVLRAILSSEMKAFTVQDYIRARGKNIMSPFIVLRHDVDDDLRFALEMARLEASLCVFSTYYIRRQPRVWIPDGIREIAELGHEIGYHYEVVSTTKGDMRRASELFQRELDDLRSIVGRVETCCMHGAVLSPWDNRRFWESHLLSDFGLEGEAYLSLAGDSLHYLSDSGYSWSNRYSVYDHFPGPTVKVRSTAGLCDLLHSSGVPDIYLLTHPILWMRKGLGSLAQYSREILLRAIKIGLIHLGGRKPQLPQMPGSTGSGVPG